LDKEPWITPEVEEAFLEYVRAGGGLLVVHSGTVIQELPTMRRLVGGTFTHHPPKCDVTVTPQGYHPITVNVEPFTVFDEHYFMETDDPEAHHFLTTTSESGRGVAAPGVSNAAAQRVALVCAGIALSLTPATLGIRIEAGKIPLGPRSLSLLFFYQFSTI
jgi:hypothetical protein